MNNNEKSVKEIRELMAGWAKALEAKNADAMHENHVERYRLFDIEKTANSSAEAQQVWEACLPYFESPKIIYKDMVIEATEDMAVVHYHSRFTSEATGEFKMPEEVTKAWIRGTLAFRKIDGAWKCIHEHASYPVNVETSEINYKLAAEA